MSCGCGGECCKDQSLISYDGLWHSLPSDGLLSGLSGLLGDLPPIHQGAWYSFGAEIDGFSITDYLNPDVDAARIQAAINQSGYAQAQTVEKVSGVINPFFVIEGVSGREYGSASHLKKAIADVIAAQGYEITPGSINFYATTYNATTGQQQSTQDVGSNNQGSSSSAGGSCNFNSMKLTDYLACQLGVTPTTAATVGIIGGLAAALLLFRAVK
ncbi:MAG: hypothetical protein BWY07_01983 [Candidatus Hydrogenedentes bacterium ADurb.Bin170]|nr:MAG: hypothetical protein BWY07_01983 [Candidatus Hydrogenedentes bacterium ADurb.Bin170]